MITNTLLFLALVARATGSSSTVTLDSQTGNYRISYPSSGEWKSVGEPIETIYEPANKLNVTLIPRLTLTTNSTMVYSYAVRNEKTSQQDLMGFDLQIGSKVADSQLTSPAHWSAQRSNAEPFAFWFRLDTATVVQVGSTTEGFIVNSALLPSIAIVRSVGRTTIPYEFPEEPPDDLVLLLNPIEQATHYSTSTTIAPLIDPAGMGTIDLLSNIATLKHQALAQGWIFGPGADGIANGLDAKLDAAQKSIQDGDNKAAANQLNAFINGLDAQRGKHVNDNAYFLLKVNAQFIVGRLQ